MKPDKGEGDASSTSSAGGGEAQVSGGRIGPRPAPLAPAARGKVQGRAELFAGPRRACQRGRKRRLSAAKQRPWLPLVIGCPRNLAVPPLPVTPRSPLALLQEPVTLLPGALVPGGNSPSGALSSPGFPRQGPSPFLPPKRLFPVVQAVPA